VTQNILTWTFGPLAPSVAFSPTGPVAFPDTTVNTTSAPTTITITNGGSAALHITTVTLAGTNPGDFAIPSASNTCGAATVAVNATCTFNVTFTPTGTGARAADLQVADDATGSPQTLSLTGNGLAAATPAVAITPASPVMFPNTVQGVASAPVTVTVTNSGNAPLTITTVTITGTNSADFVAATNTCNGAALAANATCTVGVVFTPGAVGARTATIQVADDAPASPQSAALNGSGIAAGSAVLIAPNPLALSATQGTASAPGNVTITNTGNAPLHISGIVFGGANAADFVNPASSCTAAIASNASCTIAVSFAPVTSASATARTETITLTDDAPGSPHTVTVNGTVNASAFTVTSAASALSATVTAGQTASYSLQLTPGAGYSGTVTMACSGAPATTTCSVANPITLTSGTPTTFAVMISTTARSSLRPFSNRQPLPPAVPYLLQLSMAACLAALLAFYSTRLRGASLQRQFAYGGGALIIAVAIFGVAGCASGGGSSGGGGGGTTGTQKGTYTITLTPTANGTTGKPLQLAPIQLSLTVN
jgi:hypothetical protein